MRSSAYTVQFRPDINLLDTVLHSVLTLPQAEAYMNERQAGYAAHRFGPGHLMRMDMGNYPAQSREIVDYMDRRVREFPVPGRIAVVTTSSIARLQVQRMVFPLDGNRRIFDDRDTALAWLLDHAAA